ncbi:MAG: RNA-binding domain-containing protein [Candidatus Nitrosocaldaceae archaeon]
MGIFTSVEVDIIIHATEDYKKILNILHKLFGIEEEKFILNKLEGHYGNEIIVAKIRIDYEVDKLAYKVLSKIEPYQLKKILDRLDSYIEKNYLYLRVNKQELFRNKVVLSDEEAIRFKFKFKDIRSLREWLEERDDIY